MLPDPETMAGALLDAAAIGEFAPALLAADELLSEHIDDLLPADRFRYRALFFDAAVVSTTDPRIHLRVAVDLLAEAIAEDALAWAAILATSRLDEMQRTALSANNPLELLELLSYAPDAGVRAFALTQMESVGLRTIEAGSERRDCERILHAVGASDHAYRLERERKQRLGSNVEVAVASHENDVALPYRVVAIAGGHAQMRVSAERLLARSGIETVQIPSSIEKVRREKDIVHLLQSCDVAMLLVRQITHGTSDQVRKSADRLGIPVIFSNALSAVAIERQLLQR